MPDRTLREKGQSSHKRKGSNVSQNKWAKGTGKAKKEAMKPESLRELFNGDQIATQYRSTDSVSMDLVTHTSR